MSLGRVDSDQTQTSGAGMNSPITHFSHPHELHPIPHSHIQSLVLCSGCKLTASGIMYTCISCDFSLHSSCTQFPKLITHPGHPGCNLRLLPVSSYPGGRFSCDACNHHGDGFSYHCVKCDYDLHVVCAKNPLKIMHQDHSCPLELTFKDPYETNGFCCDICRQIGAKQWLYRCSSCEFDVHLDCTKAVPNSLQPRHSFPGTGTSKTSYTDANYAARQNSLNLPIASSCFNGLADSVEAAAVQGLVEGISQEFGKNFMEGMIDGGVTGAEDYSHGHERGLINEFQRGARPVPLPPNELPPPNGPPVQLPPPNGPQSINAL